MSVYLLLPYLTVTVVAVLPLSLVSKRSPVPLLVVPPAALQRVYWTYPWPSTATAATLQAKAVERCHGIVECALALKCVYGHELTLSRNIDTSYHISHMNHYYHNISHSTTIYMGCTAQMFMHQTTQWNL